MEKEQELRDLLINKLSKNGNRVDGFTHFFKHNQEYLYVLDGWIIRHFGNINFKNIPHKLFHFLNKNTKIPKCKICEQNTDFHFWSAGYKKLCKNRDCFKENRRRYQSARIVTPETRKKLSELNTGKKLTPAVKKKISIANTGNTWTEEAKQKQSIIKRQWAKENPEKIKNFYTAGIEAAKTEKAKLKRKKTLLKKYGIDNAGRLSKKCPYSKISQELFWELNKKINKKTFFGENNGEKQIGKYKVDFCFENIIIEFYGDIYHGNPNIFKKDDKPNPYKELTCQELWENDKQRKKYLCNQGYKVYEIWEQDYHNNKQETINNLLLKIT